MSHLRIARETVEVGANQFTSHNAVGVGYRCRSDRHRDTARVDYLPVALGSRREYRGCIHCAEASLSRQVDPLWWLLSKDAFKDRKSTRLNSSHLGISYAVFCLKTKE